MLLSHPDTSKQIKKVCVVVPTPVLSTQLTQVMRDHDLIDKGITSTHFSDIENNKKDHDLYIVDEADEVIR